MTDRRVIRGKREVVEREPAILQVGSGLAIHHDLACFEIGRKAKPDRLRLRAEADRLRPGFFVVTVKTRVAVR